MGEEIKRINGLEICCETFGLRDNPCVLLIMGAMASMVWWDKDFCSQLASNNLFVIRYDNRDTGRSSAFPPGHASYTVLDLAKDSIGVLDSYEIKSAHYVGMSLGGMIGQIVALKYPERILSLTAIASGIFSDAPELPPMDARVTQYHATASDLDWNNSEAVKEYFVEGWRLLNGSRHHFDREAAGQLAMTEIRRARNLTSMFNHATLTGGDELYKDISKISIPTLVIHGTEDPVLPLPHATALAHAIKDSKFVKLEAAGHEIHKKDWDLIIGEITTLVKRAH